MLKMILGNNTFSSCCPKRYSTQRNCLESYVFVSNQLRMLTYEKWLNSIFGSSVERVTGPSWQVDSKTLVELIYMTLLRSSSDLLRFSDKQVNNGLNVIFNNSYSDIVFALQDPTVSFEARAEAVRAIKMLYSDCFDKRARPALSHLDEKGSPLNQICYMLWDVTPIRSCFHLLRRSLVTI